MDKEKTPATNNTKGLGSFVREAKTGRLTLIPKQLAAVEMLKLVKGKYAHDQTEQLIRHQDWYKFDGKKWSSCTFESEITSMLKEKTEPVGFNCPYHTYIFNTLRKSTELGLHIDELFPIENCSMYRRNLIELLSEIIAAYPELKIGYSPKMSDKMIAFRI